MDSTLLRFLYINYRKVAVLVSFDFGDVVTFPTLATRILSLVHHETPVDRIYRESGGLFIDDDCIVRAKFNRTNKLIVYF